MYGWIQDCIEALVLENFGTVKWSEVKRIAGVKEATGTFVRHKYYDEQVTLDLVAAASRALGIPAGDVLKTFGIFFVEYVGRCGYDKLLEAQGRDLEEFLNNLNTLHYHLQGTLPKLRPPDFSAERAPDGGLVLHYRSSREGLSPVVVGATIGVCKSYFGFEPEFEPYAPEKVLVDGVERTYCRFVIRGAPRQDPGPGRAPPGGEQAGGAHLQAPLALSTEEVCMAMPFHVAFDDDFVALHVGTQLRKLAGLSAGMHLGSALAAVSPHGMRFELASIERAKRSFVRLSVRERPGVILIGGIEKIGRGHVFLGRLDVNTLGQLREAGFMLSDFGIFDPTRKIVLQGEQLHAEIKSAEHMEQVNVELSQGAATKVTRKMHRDLRRFVTISACGQVATLAFGLADVVSDISAYADVREDADAAKYHTIFLIVVIFATLSSLVGLTIGARELGKSVVMLCRGEIEVIQSRFGSGGGLTEVVGAESVRAQVVATFILLGMLGAVFEDLPMTVVQIAILMEKGTVVVRSSLAVSLAVSVLALGYNIGRMSLRQNFKGLKNRLDAVLEKQSSEETNRMQKFRNSTGEAVCPFTGARAA